MQFLIVDRCPLLGELLAWELQNYGVQARAVDTLAKAELEISRCRPDVLITEIFFQDGNCLGLTSYRHFFPIIVLSAHMMAFRDSAIRDNFHACLLKPTKAIDLITVAESLVQETQDSLLRDRELLLV
uniref:Response regulator receiver protein n=1 Tax=Cyanothece sp. (strain PCC 7425 / ATCC 29141) TaxID=395961 RepID=B8HL19_CYAP4